MREYKPYLSQEEINSIKNMGLYWEKVVQREDKTPLHEEMNQLHRMFGPRILFMVLDYARREEARE